MSDANLSADKIRSMLAEANERLRKASAEYFDLLEKGLSSSPLPVADQAKQFCGYMQRNVTATFDLGDKLIQAKDMQEAGQGPVRIFPGADALTDRPCKGHGRVCHEGRDRRLYPKELKAAQGRWGGPVGTLCRSRSSTRRQWRFNSWSAASSARSTS